jgi:hypothetical protein
MGRSTPTYRDALRAIAGRWERYRCALRRVDQPRFDQLFKYARKHADATGSLNHAEPLFPALIGIDLEQEHRLDDFEERVEALEEHFDSGVGAGNRETAEGERT